MKHLLGILLSFILLGIPVFGYDGGYSIDSYNVAIHVGEDNIFDIKEDINVNFTEEGHGIYRSIPVKKYIKHLDGTVSQVVAQISNIKCNIENTYYSEGKDKVIKIGNAEELVIGKQDYVLSYTYDLGKDLGNGYDEFYFNIIGTEWDTTINEVSFQINMPKAFDKDQVGFSVGTKGSIDSDNIYYTVEGNAIIGSYKGVLNPNEGITIRIELPEGYFNATTSHITWTMNLNMVKVIPLATVLIIIVLKLIFATNSRGNVGMYPYPPQGFNSAEIGMLYRGSADNKAILSLLFSLAQKGYLKIINKVTYKSFFAIEKVKDYDGEDTAENIFFQGLFRYGERVDPEDLHDSCYKTLKQLRKIINKKKRGIFEKSTDGVKSIAIILAILCYGVVMTICGTYANQDAITKLCNIIFMSVGLWIIIQAIRSRKLVENIILLVFGVAVIGKSISLMTDNYPEIRSIIIINIVCLGLMFWVIKHMIRLTPYGQKLYMQTKEFKNYLENVDKGTLIKIREENPDYFYEMLAYMMALGISKESMEKFNVLATASPTWCEGIKFDSCRFHSHIYRIMEVIEQSMISTSGDFE